MTTPTDPLARLEKLANEANPKWRIDTFLDDREGHGEDHLFAIGPLYTVYGDDQSNCQDDCPSCLAERDASFMRLASPATILTLIKVIREQREALIYYEHVCPEWNVEHYIKRAKQARAETDKLLEGIC